MVVLGTNADGSPWRKWVYATTEKKLNEKIEEAKNEARTGTTHEAAKITVAQLLDVWMERHIAKKEPKTRRFYQFRVNDIKAVIGNIKVKDLTPLHIEDLLDTYRDQVSGTTLHHTFCTLRAALNRGAKWRLAPTDNPCKAVDTPRRTTKRPQPYTQDEVAQILTAAEGTIMYPFVVAAIFTGCREGELLGLTWANVDFTNSTLHVVQQLEDVIDGEAVTKHPKTDAGVRDIPIGPELAEVLTSHRSHQQVMMRLAAGAKWKDTGLVFTNHVGGPLADDNLRDRYWYPLLEKARVRRTHIHDLRHLFATALLSEVGEDIKTVQALLGHTVASTTLNMYAHARDDAKKRAITKLDAHLKTRGRKKT